MVGAGFWAKLRAPSTEEDVTIPSDALPGVAIGDTVAGKYLIDAILGVGGMGVVYRARHLEIDAPVALKFLSAQFRTDTQAIGRFRREAQAAAKLRSEHVVRVFDVGLHDTGLPYLVMEYLEGKDLGRLIRNGGPLSVELTADLLLQTCAALEDAHEKGIIHRDLKPSNLFCVERPSGGYLVKVVDFGISKVTSDSGSHDHGITVTGNIVGSPSYMSPEQMKNSSGVDRRTDIWSLGVVLYECVTGSLPFPGDTYAEICLKAHQDPPVPVLSHGVALPDGLEAVIHRCLAKEPERRFASAAALSEALLAFAPVPARTSVRPASLAPPSDERKSAPRQRLGLFRGASGAPSSTLPSWAHTPPPPGTRRWWPALLAAAAGLLLLGAVALLFRRPSSTPAVAPTAPPSQVNAALPPSSVAPAPRSETPLVAPLGPVLVPPTVTSAVPAPASARPVARGSAASKGTASAPPSSAVPARPRPPAAERDSRSSVWSR